jgi:hypothetical protein
MPTPFPSDGPFFLSPPKLNDGYRPAKRASVNNDVILYCELNRENSNLTQYVGEAERELF